jgi:hypothetical protein
MSQQQFDDLTRSVATSVSRRHALKAIAGGVLGAAGAALLGTRHAEASGRPCRQAGANCSFDEQCCSHFCYEHKCVDIK